MKKTLALILAIVMALGCMSITAFAADNEATISAEITAADFGYTMVIPTSTTLTEAKHENVLLGTTAAADGDGIVSIKDIKHPTDKVNVYYTVDLTNGDLTDGTNTIAATYKYKQGENAFTAIDGTTKVTVYANKTVTNSLVNVTADDTQWKAAPTGTYNATVVFNFAKEDAAKVFATVEEILATAPEGSFDYIADGCQLWYNSSSKPYEAYFKDDALYITTNRISIPLNASVVKQEDGSYKFVMKNEVEDGGDLIYFVFKLSDDKLTAIEGKYLVRDYADDEEEEMSVGWTCCITYHEKSIADS